MLAGGDWGFADGRGTQAKFGYLHSGSMLVASDGALLLTEDSARVRRVTPGGTMSTLAGGIHKGDTDARGTDARFDGASGLAFDAQGNVLVVEQVGRIREISPDGTVTTLGGSGNKGSDDGPLLEATFDEPTGIAVAPSDDWFVLEPHRPRVRKISNGRVTTIHQGVP